MGINKVRILKWYFINILTFNYWLIIVITPAAGKDGGKHIDIYNLRRRIEKGRLLNKLKENNRGEEIYLFAFFNLLGLVAFFFHLRRRGVAGSTPLLKKSIASILETEDEKEVLSLFKSGGTNVMKEKFKGIEDFKLISFLIIK